MRRCFRAVLQKVRSVVFAYEQLYSTLCKGGESALRLMSSVGRLWVKSLSFFCCGRRTPLQSLDFVLSHRAPKLLDEVRNPHLGPGTPALFPG